MVQAGSPLLRSFDEHTVVAAASAAFTDLGYEATSVEDLLQVTGLHRGSLYQAFGSKRGLFLAALRAHLPAPTGPGEATRDPDGEGAAWGAASTSHPASSTSDPADATLLDLLLVAALELAPRDEEVRALVVRALTQQTGPEHAALLLGRGSLCAPTSPPPTPTRTQQHEHRRHPHRRTAHRRARRAGQDVVIHSPAHHPAGTRARSHVDPDVAAEPKGLRHPGLAVPGKWAGTLIKDGDTCFWNVSSRRSGHRRTIVVQLDQENYQRPYLTVADPRATVDAINAALSRP